MMSAGRWPLFSGSLAIVFTPRFEMEADITMSDDEIGLLIALWVSTNVSGIHLIPAIL